MRLFTALLGTETNTFSPLPAGFRLYRECYLVRGGRHTEPLDFFAVPLVRWRERAKAKGWEVEVIETLRKNPAMERDVRIRDTENGPFYTVTYPLVIRNADCLTCHSTPEKAPPSLIALYGSKNGFGWKLNETIGAQIISVPMANADAKIWRNFILFISITSAIFLCLLILLDFMLHRLVIRPVRSMAVTAEKVSMGDASVPEYQYPSTDEVGSLSRSFNRMRRSLDSAMKMLDS